MLYKRGRLWSTLITVVETPVQCLVTLASELALLMFLDDFSYISMILLCGIRLLRLAFITYPMLLEFLLFK